MSDAPVLQVEGLVKHFPIQGGLLQRQVGAVRAVDGVTFSIRRGETLGLVGESGCGKSTIGKVVLKLIEPTAGKIVLAGEDVTALKPGAMWTHRRRIQTIFQDPYSSMNPRLPSGTIVGEPLENFGIARGAARDEQVAQLFRRVGLRPEAMRKYAHEFSGGQRQRLGIAKALSVNPDVIVADEPVSALDVSVRAQVINLLEDLKSQFGVSYLFISHDLSVVEHIADRVAVMYLGMLFEVGGRDQIWREPRHPYTRALLAAAPIANPKLARARQRTVLQGELPSPLNPPPGCPFNSRCPMAQDRCRVEKPALRAVGNGVQAACHFV
ncbi:dipeptide ABC transporter ATP-binding protein [Reyranella sp.]|uniref:ABC transporter ATP-binding protein n=1 Tax=Reyranella sp. TaxID=1929291 RepID=UPI00263795F4|nr:dipeptide ABC transporter ATP-binding protein [Reyranella sp.]